MPSKIFKWQQYERLYGSLPHSWGNHTPSAMRAVSFQLFSCESAHSARKWEREKRRTLWIKGKTWVQVCLHQRITNNKNTIIRTWDSEKRERIFVASWQIPTSKYPEDFFQHCPAPTFWARITVMCRCPVLLCICVCLGGIGRYSSLKSSKILLQKWISCMRGDDMRNILDLSRQLCLNQLLQGTDPKINALALSIHTSWLIHIPPP